jgi:hypothetical protein
MDLSKIAPIDATPIDPTAPGGQAGPAPRQGADPIAAALEPPPPDRADIRPLDVSGAMRILIAEIRAGLDLPAAADGSDAPDGWTGAMAGAGVATQGPLQTARQSIQLLLDALPGEDADPAADSAAVAGVELDFHAAMDRALAAIANWPEVPKGVIDAAVEVRVHVTTLTTEDPAPNNALWLRPEFLGLAPGILAFRRRRRSRGLTDPDFAPAREEEAERPVDSGDRPREEPP